ncbi:MAG: TIR domain-containing protein [Acidimicrobiia bacterium]
MRSWLKQGLASPKIFISYRRSDAGGHAGRLQDALAAYYGDRAVWLDHTDIGPGQEFAEALDQALTHSDVLLAIIGPDWLTAEKEGRRRLDDPEDWVRREVVTALGLGRVQVIPVLVGEAPLPEPEDLPEPLQRIPKLQAITVRPDRFEDDVDHLTERIGGWRRRWHGFPLWTWLLGAAMVVGGLTAAFVIRSNRPPLVATQQVSAIGGIPTEIDIASWVTDEEPAGLVFSIENETAHGGTVADNGGGRVTYTGPGRYSGPDSFGFTVRDEHGAQASEIVNVTVSLGPIGGDFNVAVAEFSATAQTSGARLSHTLFEQIATTLGAETDVNIEVAGPSEVGALAGDTPEGRAEAAADLADRVGADVVVYGTLEILDGLSNLSAEFYVSSRGLTGAEELAGVYPLDTVSLGTSDPLALSQAASRFLEPKIIALTQLAIGLSHYQLNEYAEAEALFNEAVASWPSSAGRINGQEVVLSLLGNVSGLQGDVEAADDFFTRALDLDPDYSRARFGAAEVGFQRSRGSLCGGSGEADIVGLEDAVRQFEELIDLPAPPLAFLPERARLEIGRIYQCLTLNGVDRRDDAREILEAVIADISGETRLRDLEAEAHFSLGIYHLLNGDRPAALAEFDTAVDTTVNPIRKRGFYLSLGVIHLCQLDQPDLAETYLRAAEDLPGPPLEPIDCAAK